METYEQRIEIIARKLFATDEWLGVKMDMRTRRRKELLKEVREILGEPKSWGNATATPFQKLVTTNIEYTEGGPDFVIDLEKDVYKEGLTEILKFS